MAKKAETEVVRVPLEKPETGTDSPVWTQYVLSQLTDDELSEGEYPTTDGLRRIFEKLVGKITDVKTNVYESPTIANGARATVGITITYRPHNELESFFTLSEAADCGAINTDHPYSKHPVATAVTRAEGRCYRKGLRLQRVITADEKSNLTVDDERSVSQEQAAEITVAQKRIIKSLCARNNINMAKLLEFKQMSSDIELLTHAEGAELLRQLNKYNVGPDNKEGEAIPDGIKQ